MYCPACQCEFEGWSGRCPTCETSLIHEVRQLEDPPSKSIAYEALVNLLAENDGQIQVDLSTNAVGLKRSWGFPYLGFRFAWVKRMHGFHQEFSVDIVTTDVGMERRWSFPFFGYGYAWGRQMQGSIGGNEANLIATKVSRDRKRRFPYRGYGYAWVEELMGECGAKINLSLAISEVGKKAGWRFPYLGYGSAWAKKGILTLMQKE